MWPTCVKATNCHSSTNLGLILKQKKVVQMSLQELIYTSLAEPVNARRDVSDILGWSEKYNASAGITGLLLFDGSRYIQILEGDPKTVDTLFKSISNDTRHFGIELLHTGQIEERSFRQWRMAYESLPAGLLEHLAENIGASAFEAEDRRLSAGDSFGARLNNMFMTAVAAE